ncbi:MAG: type II restriction endonuclease [Brevinema sp.]
MKKTTQEGSETAKNGFKNEQFVIDLFNAWKSNELAQEWLIAMGYKISEIEFVKAIKIIGSFKADIQVQISITIKLKEEVDCQNISIKLVSNPQGFNQIDKRWIDKYIELWNIPQDISKLLKYYTGELKPYKSMVRDERRMFIDEFEQSEQDLMIQFFEQNKVLILTDILKGRGQFSAEWMLVIYKQENKIESVLKPINEVLNFYAQGNVEITKQGNIKIGRIGIQRKGVDGGRPTANMLQFKMNPMDLFNI